MELPRSRRPSQSLVGGKTECGLPYASVGNEKRSRTPVVLSCMIILALVASSLYYDLFLSFVCDSQSDKSPDGLFGVEAHISSTSVAARSGNVLPERTSSIEDRTLAGLLPDPSEFEPDVCASRNHQPHRKNYFQPSKELISRLRRYEVRHRECASQARNFFRTQKRGKKGDCRYVVWIGYSGLGNRLMSLSSAFLYALLTDRILLVDGTKHIGDLLCEPIPKASWLLPPEFTVEWLQALNESSPQRFRHLPNSTDGGGKLQTADFSYVQLTHTSDHRDESFFCDESQDHLESVPWVFMKTNNYLPPAYYFVSKFSADLAALFPDREVLFHVLGNYLFHPSDMAWEWITRFYRSYLSDRDRLVGIQIRTFHDSPLPHFAEQLQQCILNNDLLPKVVAGSVPKPQISGLRGPKNGTTVLMTGLDSYYFDNLRDYFLSGPTESGEIVAIHQPSHEGYQQTDIISHDLKAWAEIYLLSLSDTLITSGWSTFGYSAQSLAGIRPWILFRATDDKMPDTPCVRATLAKTLLGVRNWLMSLHL
ncbi:hypothetical protein R1sor_010324 [Riccia sorocarpa]|uniref:Fucosyltransferase n=1 Tax=Riccia sorocarpa TaxID=122646 RepID=A0ABD3HXY0_9MARC